MYTCRFQMIKEVQKTEAGKKLTAAGEEALKQVFLRKTKI